MKKAEIKRILNAMIDNLADKYILYDLKENIFPYVIKYRTRKIDKADDNLTEEQTMQLGETIRYAGAGQIVSNKEFKKLLPGERKQKKKDDKKIAKISKKKLRKKLHALIDGIKSKYILNVLLDDIMPDAINNSRYER